MTQRNVHTIRGGVKHRLNIGPLFATGGGIASVPHGDGAVQGAYNRFIENIRDQAHVFKNNEAVPITDADTSGFLATMLQCEKAKVAQLRNILTRSPDAKDAALFTGFLLALVI